MKKTEITKLLKRTIGLIALSAILITSIFSLSGCGSKYEMSDIEPRLKALIDESYAVNDILFGSGLETYERIYDPKTQIKTLRDDPECGMVTYYYELEDAEYGRVFAYRTSYLKPYSYAYVTSTPVSDADAIYSDEKESVYAYPLEGYEEAEAEFYYSESDPKDYDYVRFDSEIRSVDGIKAAAEKVYSRDYLASIYEMLFTGAVTEDGDEAIVATARFYEYTNDMGSVYLMESNTYEPILTLRDGKMDKRVYDLSTAKIVKPYRSDFVNVRVDSYLESSPDTRLTVTLTLVMQDGEWYLDSPTY